MLARRLVTVLCVLAGFVFLCFITVNSSVSHAAKEWMTPPGKHGQNGNIPGTAEDVPKRIVHPVVDKTFLLLKTGIEVSFSRLPPHVNTTFSQFRNYDVYADTGDSIDGIPVIDCLKYLDNETLNDDSMKSYRIRRQAEQEHWHWMSDRVNIRENPRDGWNLDRFKNVPAFAHGWLHNPGYDWYIMIDADTYLLGSTLQAVTEGHDPNEPWYFGRSVGRNPAFAHGGSTIVFSRRAMEMMFGNTQESINSRIAKGGESAILRCCGDSVMSYMYTDATGIAAEKTLEGTQMGRFQGGAITNQYVTFYEWCNPVGSFHKLPPWEVSVLHDWELSKGLKTITYADFYYDFVMPDLAEEKPNWNVDYSNEFGLDHMSFSGDQLEAYDKKKCIQACENDERCTMWVFRGNEECTILRESICAGRAMNRFSKDWKNEWTEVTTGYMIDRIRTFREAQTCNPPDTRAEGWRYKPKDPGDIVLTNVLLDVDEIAKSRAPTH